MALSATTEELVQANSDLLEANRKVMETRELGQLVAGIAHEINNPLAFVVSNLFVVESGVATLAAEIKPRLSEEFLKKLQKTQICLEEMREGLNYIKELVEDLRTFSRLDEGEFKPVDVVDTIDSVLLLLKHRMHNGIQVAKHYGPERRLYCDAGPLKQVLMNLISNAADAIAGEGRIVITTSQTAEDFLISVRDTGGGIPQVIRSKIFDPFFTTKPAGRGTGLGLAICGGIVQDHGGSIAVRSQEGAGAEFIVKIPRDLESRRRA